jgi:hypothetical protein
MADRKRVCLAPLRALASAVVAGLLAGSCALSTSSPSPAGTGALTSTPGPTVTLSEPTGANNPSPSAQPAAALTLAPLGISYSSPKAGVQHVFIGLSLHNSSAAPAVLSLPDTASLTIQEESRRIDGDIEIYPQEDPESKEGFTTSLLQTVYSNFPIAPGMTICGLDDQSHTIYAVTHGRLSADFHVPQNTHPVSLRVPGFADLDLHSAVSCSVPAVQATKLPAIVDLPGTTAQLSINGTGTVAELKNLAALDPTSPLVSLWAYTSTGDIVPPENNYATGGQCVVPPNYRREGWQLGPAQAESISLCFPTDGHVRYLIVAFCGPGLGINGSTPPPMPVEVPPYSWVLSL